MPDRAWTIDDLFSIKPPVMRALMQEYGTEVRRGDDTNYWVEKWKIAIGDGTKNIVTDDVRFYNELAALGDVGGVLVRVVRPDITTGGTHQSETEQEAFIEDFGIEGVPGMPDAIEKQIDSIIQTIKSNND